MSNLKQWFNEINELECFGYLPASSSVKPAHIANGWFGRLLGKHYDPVLLNRTVVPRTTAVENLNPSELLLTEYPSVFEPFRPVAKRSQFEDFRADLKALVSPVGGAVNNGNHASSYNVTCDRHLTGDRAEAQLGAFLHQLVSLDCGNGPSPVVDLISKTLLHPIDEISVITAPLVCAAASTEIRVGTYRADGVFKRKGKVFVSPTLKNLRAGFDNLGSFEATYGGGVDALRRLVAFGVFSLLLHMTNRQAEMSGLPGPSPLLLYFPVRPRSTAYQASHATYLRAHRLIETLYTERLVERLVMRVGKRPATRKLEQFIKELDFRKKKEKNKDKEKEKENEKEAGVLKERFLKSFKSFSSQLDPLHAMAEALRESSFRSASATPLAFYRQLGVKSGFVRPAGNALRKYYTLEGDLLEALLASILPQGQMTYRVFLDQLYLRYGLITGGRPEDPGILSQHGVGNATVQDLRTNSQVFRQHLISLGWARLFADGVLVVKVPEGLQ